MHRLVLNPADPHPMLFLPPRGEAGPMGWMFCCAPRKFSLLPTEITPDASESSSTLVWRLFFSWLIVFTLYVLWSLCSFGWDWLIFYIFFYSRIILKKYFLHLTKLAPASTVNSILLLSHAVGKRGRKLKKKNTLADAALRIWNFFFLQLRDSRNSSQTRKNPVYSGKKKKEGSEYNKKRVHRSASETCAFFCFRIIIACMKKKKSWGEKKRFLSVIQQSWLKWQTRGRRQQQLDLLPGAHLTDNGETLIDAAVFFLPRAARIKLSEHKDLLFVRISPHSFSLFSLFSWVFVGEMMKVWRSQLWRHPKVAWLRKKKRCEKFALRLV